MTDSSTYLLSSFKNNPERLFQGYCFAKEDFIFGQSGADKYFEHTGKQISYGEDGCYVLAKKVEKGFLIGSDFSGFKKILYFYDKASSVWAVSNSLSLLINHLKEHSINVTPNVALLMMSTERLSFTQQPITFDTIANEIKILPVNTLLTIGGSCLKIEKINDIGSDTIDYRQILINFVNIWISRFSTLLSNDELFIRQGLTGGLDSRAVFSLSNLAYHQIDTKNTAEYRLACHVIKGCDKDIKVAEKITKYFGYKLNAKTRYSDTIYHLDAEEKYLTWKNLCLGVYQPIYFPSTKVDYRKISIGGGGGENHRTFYGNNPKTTTYNDSIRYLCSKLDNPEQMVDLAINLFETLSVMQDVDHCGDDIDALLLHYRHFRNRFHTGLFPQYQISFTPLSSRYLANIATKKNFEKVKSSQVLYDIINITDKLIDFPYDKVAKNPSSNTLSQLTKLREELSITTGTIYAENNSNEKVTSSKPIEKTLEYLKKDFDKACKSKLVQKLWSNSFINKASQDLDEAISRGRFNHASEGSSISLIIAAALFKTSNSEA
ncbi:hypothetical protein [Psychrobacter sp. FME5]|uniref:hypothetical protein n=1 Tax=Psychrobacter sp. FME5 TaxID=2487706 RepID=UPI0017878400|nr:hypothetical protein [Psychrobacter sp. FME5]MBE0444164.1 hypothetical protein [Psychrobacter sp. FME5]